MFIIFWPIPTLYVFSAPCEATHQILDQISLDSGKGFPASVTHTVLLRTDGNAVAVEDNGHGRCNIPLPEPGICYVGDLTCGRDLVLQLEAFWWRMMQSPFCLLDVGEERFAV